MLRPWGLLDNKLGKLEICFLYFGVNVSAGGTKIAGSAVNGRPLRNDKHCGPLRQHPHLLPDNLLSFQFLIKTGFSLTIKICENQEILRNQLN